MAEHLSLSELEGEAKKLKRDLEAWREVILPLNSILLWEKNSYLGIIVGTVSAVFFLLWQMNPNVLTIISYLGIIITVVDYLIPTYTLHFCHPERWTSAQERKLELICRTLAANKILLTNYLRSFYQMKTDKPAYYYSAVITSLLFLSWIGNVVNNLFLTYLLVTGLLLLPGLQQHGLIDKYATYLHNLIKDRTGNNSANLKSE